MLIVILEIEEDDTPKPDFKPPPVVPREEDNTGPNKKKYFVCNDRKYCTTVYNTSKYQFSSIFHKLDNILLKVRVFRPLLHS